MKHSTGYWILRGIVPSVVVTALSAYAARCFEPAQDTLFLYQFFIILLTLAAMAVTVFSVYAVVAYIRSSYKDLEKVWKLSLDAWFNIVAAIVIGATCWYGARLLGLSLLWSCALGILAFIGYLLGPIAKDIAKQMRAELSDGQLPDATSETGKQAMDEANPDAAGGDTVINTAMTSNVMVNVVVQSAQAEETQSATGLDTPTHEKIESAEPSKNDKSVKSTDTPKPAGTATSTKEEIKEPVEKPVEEPAKDQPAQADDIPDSGSIPADLPKELSKYPIITIFRELANEQVLTKDFKLETNVKTVTNGQLALLVDLISSWFGISNKWKVFESYWGLKNMGQAYKQVKGQELARPLYNAIARAHKDVRVNGIKVVSNWIRLYEMRNKINQGLR